MVVKKAKVSEMFDNVLADTETAFQFVANCLARLLPATASLCVKLLVRPLVGLLSYILMLAATLALFLPSFFTLLVLRATKVETESKAFGIRQAVILRESCGRKTLRWIAVRSVVVWVSERAVR